MRIKKNIYGRYSYRALIAIAVSLAVFIPLLLLSGCATTSLAYLRHDGTFAVKGDSFKERW